MMLYYKISISFISAGAHECIKHVAPVLVGFFVGGGFPFFFGHIVQLVILVSHQGSNPGPRHRKYSVLTTGP